ncbi:WD40/YVTN/BNR-like repeat-containing protein [Corallincola platygyrae]|uniref:WD40/YVTN/BNR-like repeat-containing protein n=1 Tax=Corallincola platygyrae TaxID=1193278 RepID=A0ABW4XL09_9GAMM
MGREVRGWPIIGLATAFLSFPSFADMATGALIVPNAANALTLDFATTGSQVFAFGERGHILELNELNDWQQIDSPTKTTLTRGFFAGQHGWAVGHEATILHTPDAGKHWTIQHAWAGQDRPLLDITFLDDNHGIAIGAYGLYLETNDGGNNWHQRFLTDLLYEEDKEYLEEIRLESEEEYLIELNSMLPHFNAITVQGTKLVIAGEMGLVAVSDDKGKTWQRLDSGYEGSYFAVKALSESKLLVAGLRGTLRLLSDDRWQNLSFSQPITINNLVLMDEHLWALGNGGHYFKLTDNEGGYEHYQLTETPALLDAVFVDQQPVLASAEGILVNPPVKSDK